jgi:hypothetical protein
MGYERLNFKDGDVLLSSQLNHIEDGIVNLEKQIGNTIIDDNKYGLITQQSSCVTLHPGTVGGTYGNVATNSDYDSWIFTIENDCEIYVREDEKLRNRYFSLTVVPSGGGGTRYRYLKDSEDTLPTEASPLTVTKNSTIVITIPAKLMYWSLCVSKLDNTVSSDVKNAIDKNQLILQYTHLYDDMKSLLILKKCGNHDDLFLGQLFYKKVSKNNVNCWRLAECALWKRIGNEFCHQGDDIIISGEWECAIQEKGAADFVGGNAHGDENLISIFTNLDGKSIEFNDVNFLLCGNRLEIIRNSILNRCDTPGDDVMKHIVRYDITPDELIIYQSIEFLQEMELINSYLLMAPVARNYTNWGYFDTHNEIVDISTAGHSSPKIYGKQGHVSMWSDNFSIQIDFLCEGGFEKQCCFISPSTTPPYNKVYHNFVGIGTSVVAEAGHKISQLNKYIYNYNE